MAETTDETTPFDIRPNVRAPGRSHRRAAGFARACRSVCELAAGAFGLPMAFLSLYEDGALIPAATFGIADIEVLDTLVFLRRPLIAGEGVLIGDASRDARYFLESAVLHAPHIRFYADMPLVYDGEILGVIAIADSAPCLDFSASKQSVLAQFADQAATLLALMQGSGNDRRGEGVMQQKRMDMAADMAGFGYWTIDLATREAVWSKGLYALLGLNEEAVRPEVAALLDLYAPDDRPGVIECFQRAVNDGEDFDFTRRIVRPGDRAARLIRTRGGVEHDRDDTPVRLCGIVCDVTETPAAREGFLGHIADELRAPLNEIVGYARLIGTRSVSGAEIAGFAHNLLASAGALESLIGDALTPEAAVEDEGEIVDAAALIRETVEAFLPQAVAAQTRLSTHFVDFTRANARLDVMRVRQVLQNLLSNACKFTRGGIISVTASQVAAENPRTLKPEIHLHVSVRDTGAGMTETQARSLFDGSQTGGKRGLGLCVARTIVEMLGGHIGATARPGEGSHVWFEIPADWAEAPAVMGPDPKAAPSPRTLTRQYFGGPPSRPAYAPPVRRAPVDENRINREYLRALLEDMKPGL